MKKQIIIDTIKYNRFPFRFMMGCHIISFALLYLSITYSYYLFFLFFPGLVLSWLTFSNLKNKFKDRYKEFLDEKKQKEDWAKMSIEERKIHTDKQELEHSLLLEKLRKERANKYRADREFAKWEDMQKQKEKSKMDGGLDPLGQWIRKNSN